MSLPEQHKNLPAFIEPLQGDVTVIYVNNPFDLSEHVVEYHDLKDGVFLVDAVTDEWPEETTHSSINGEIITREEWDTATLQHGDYVVIMQAPAGDSGKDILRLVALVAIAVFAPQFGAWAAGLEAGAAMTTAAYAWSVAFVVAGSLLVNAILPPALPDGIGSADLSDSPTYGIDGAKNTSDEGIPVPVCYGEFRMAGNIINLRTQNIGNTQYLYMLINAGEGEIGGIGDVELNEQPITSYNNAEVQYRLGTATQDVMEWFDDTYTPVAVGVTLDESYTTRTTGGAVDKLRFDFVCPEGLIEFNDDGTRVSRTVTLEIQYKLTTEPTNWTTLYNRVEVVVEDDEYNYYGYNTYDSEGNFISYTEAETRGTLRDPGDIIAENDFIIDLNGETVGTRRKSPTYSANPSITRKQTSAVRFSFITGTLTEGTYDVRVRRIGAESTEATIKDKVAWTDLNEIVSDNVAYKHTALVGLRVKLTDQLSSLPKVTYMNAGKVIKVWDATNGIWTDKVSNNPAWIAYDILSNTRYGAGIAESRIDKDKWIEWGIYCDTESLTFNGVLDQKMSLWDALMHVFRAGHARPISYGTKYSVAIDRAEAPTQMFTVGNIIKDSFSQNWMSLTDRANEIDISFFDKNDKYKKKTVKVYDDAIAAGEPQKVSSVTLYGVNDHVRATEEAVYMMNSNRLMRSTVSFRAPLEAIAVQVGDVFLLQHDQPDWSQGGRLAAGSTTTNINFDRPITFEVAKSYDLLVRYDSLVRESRVVSAVNGRRIALTGFSGTTDIDRLTYGSVDTRITRIEGTDAVWVEDATGLSTSITVDLVKTDAIETRTVDPLADGDLTTISVTSAFPSAPAEYAVFMVGEPTIVQSLWRCTRIDIGNDLTATITGAEYNADIYDWTPTDGSIAPPVGFTRVVPHVTNLSVSETTVNLGGILRPAVDVSWDLPVDFEDYGGADVELSIDGSGFVSRALVYGETFTTIETGPGAVVDVRVVAMSSDGRFALRSTAPTDQITMSGDPFAPGAPTSFVISAGQIGINLSWTNPIVADFAGVDIKRNTANNEPAATVVFTTDKYQTSWTDTFPDDPGTNYYYWIRSVDVDGNASAWVASSPTNVSPTALASGVDATSGWLTNESHNVPADNDGSNPDFTGANGYFKVYKGTNDITATSTFAVQTLDNTTATINTADNTPVNGQPKGYYEVTGETVAQDLHTVTFRATTVDSVVVDKDFSISKTRDGLNATGKTVALAASSQMFTYDNSTGTPSLIGPSQIDFTVNHQNTTGGTTWQAWDHTGTEILPVSNVLTSMTDNGAVMLESGAASFSAITNNDFIRVRATREGIYDEITVVQLSSGQDGALAKTITVSANSRTIYRIEFEFDVPGEWYPSQIDFTANRQNLSGGTVWNIYDDTGAELTPTSTYLSNMTNTTATFTSTTLDSISNNDFVRVRATADGLFDEVTVVRATSGSSGISHYLTNETHVVPTESDLSGADLTGFSGTHIVQQGYADKTTVATHSVLAPQTVDGLTLTVGSGTGIYSFTGTWGTADTTAEWTLRAIYAGQNFDRKLTLIKSPKGVVGDNAVTVYLTNETHNVSSLTDGTGADLSGADDGGTFKIFDGLVEKTTDAAVTFSIVGGTDNTTNWTKTQNGVTMTLTQADGTYDVSGSWTAATDTEVFTLRANYGGNNYDKVYTLTKSKTGSAGTPAKTVILSAEAQAFSYDNTTASMLLIGPSSITLTVNEQNTTGSTTWSAWDHTGAAISPITNILTNPTDSGATVDESKFALIGNNNFVKIRAEREGIWDEVTIHELVSGEDGDPGTIWYDGSGAPAGGLGLIGDRYLDNDNGDVYEKTGASTWTLTGNIKGPSGGAGTNVATVTLYAKNTSDITSPTPAFAGPFTYTFADGSLTGGTLGAWSQDAPSIAQGEYLWASQATASSTETTDTVATVDFNSPQVVGIGGTDALNAVTVSIFGKNTSSVTPPTPPTGPFTYTFSTGVLSGGTLSPWSQNAPDIVAGEYLWQRQAYATSTTDTDTVNEGDFNTAQVIGIGGIDGDSLYTWIKYAPNGSPTAPQMTDTPQGDTTHIGISYNNASATESTDPLDYDWSLIQGNPGSVWHSGSGVPSAGLGVDGDYYLNTDNGDVYEKVGGSWGSPVDNLQGTAGATWYTGSGAPLGALGVVGDLYLDEDNGDVYEKTGASTWTNTTNIAGASLYTWIAYSSTSDGTGDFTTGTPTSVHTYIGISYNETSATESQTPGDYTWSLIKGADGANGYIYDSGTINTAWATSATKATATQFNYTSDLPGTASIIIKLKDAESDVLLAHNETDLGEPTYGANDAEIYSEFFVDNVVVGTNTLKVWSDVGDGGFVQHIRVIPTGRGYMWVAYADSADGTTNFTTGDPGGRQYIGISTGNYSPVESTDPTAYNWSLFQGSYWHDGTGVPSAGLGNNGDRYLDNNNGNVYEKVDGSWVQTGNIEGPAGGSLYTWIKYTNDTVSGPLTDDPTGMNYVGFAYNKTSATESTTPGDYSWSLIKGADGRDAGIIGGVKINYASFTVANDGEMYVHGLDGNGDPADVDAIYIYNGQRNTLTKGYIYTNMAVNSGFLVLETGAGTPFTGASANSKMAAAKLTVSDGTASWEYDNNTAWAPFTATDTMLIIGFYSSGTDLIKAATLVAPIPLATGVLDAAHINAASLSAITAIIGNLQTRTSGAASTPLLKLSDSTSPLQIFDTDGTSPLFSLSTASGNLKLLMKGDFVDYSINSGNMFSETGITLLRQRLGLLEPSAGTGGSVTLASAQDIYSGTFNTWKYINVNAGGVVETNGTGGIASGGQDVQLNFNVYGYEFGPGQTAPLPAPTWEMQWEYRRATTGGPGTDWTAWAPVDATLNNARWQFTADLREFTEPGGPTDYQYILNESPSYTWAGSNLLSGWTYEYRVAVRQITSGGYTGAGDDLLTASASEAIVGGGVIEAHTHDASHIDTGTFANARIAESNVTQHEGALTLAASQTTTGTFGTARIPSLDAGKITTGTFATARIPSLDAGKITTGTFAVARIPTLTASKISDFDTEVSNNSSVAANTAKVSNATHTGEVTGSGALTVQPSAITNRSDIGTVASGDSLLAYDVSALALREMTISALQTYMQNNLSFLSGSVNFNDLANKTSGTGNYSTSGYLQAGRNNGGVALTNNDGQGNANVTFNHVDGIAEQAGNSGRIVVNTDSTSGATMTFELKSNASAGAVTTIPQMILGESSLDLEGNDLSDVLDINPTNSALTSGLLSTDELYVSDGGTTLRRMDVSVLQTYMQSNLSFPPGAEYARHITTGYTGSARIYVQATTPSSPTPAKGDIWFNTGASTVGDADTLDGLDSVDFARLGTVTPTADYCYVTRSHSTGAVIYVRQAGAGDMARFFTNATSGTTSGSSQITFTNGGGITATGNLVGNHVRPNTTATYDLGSSTLEWQNLYVNNIHLGNTSRTLSTNSGDNVELENHCIAMHDDTTYESARITFSSTTIPTTQGASGDIWFKY